MYFFRYDRNVLIYEGAATEKILKWQTTVLSGAKGKNYFYRLKLSMVCSFPE